MFDSSGSYSAAVEANLVDVNVIPLDSPTSPVDFGRDYDDSHTQKVLVAQNKEENSSI